MSDTTANHSADYVLLTRLADEFAARYRAGERPSLQEYIDRHPELADDIRELLPAMVEIEQVKEDHHEATEQGAAQAAPAIRQLGDFRILREVGKGGMGIVYEAEQVSLGRHVALKVLPRNMLLDARAKRRFEREAKSAAKLHHTNIVPVFGVGEQDGMPYYVMQFIQGLGLDDVLEEVKNLQSGGAKAGTYLGGDLRASHNVGQISHGRGNECGRKTHTHGAVSAVNVARSLLTGELHSPLDHDEATAPVAVGEAGDATAAVTVEDAGERDPGPAIPRSPATSDSFRLSSSPVALPGQSRDGSRTRNKKRTYWQSVASIGAQVAEALEYAHKQGIQHRDIKPSNLLLDAQGTVWVTDFGLAKADDHQNLTHTGDILGTLRYMPPEAFEGKTDARSDVYSLGLTLYEMLAFRAAFDEKERNRLIKQVTEAEPVRLGKLNRHVPQDLQTIVHKAIDKDPARRYASGEALAEDLQRFIADEPIRARQVSAAERYWRWARRNPVIATLGGVLTAVLTVGFAVMALLWSHAERSASIARSNEAKAQTLATKEAKARGEAQEQERIAQEQERIALEKAELLAREDYVNRVNRAYGEVQDDNIALAEDLLHGCEPKRRGWEWNFVERLCNSERRVIDVGNSSVNALAISPDGTWAVSGSGAQPFGNPLEAETTLDVWDAISGHRRKTLPGAKGIVYTVAVSPDGKQVAAGCSAGLVLLWNVETGQTVWTRSDPGLNAMSVAFRPDGKSLAVGYGAYSGDQVGRVKVWNVASGVELKAFSGPRGGVNAVAFHPDGKRLGVAGLEVVEVWDLETARKLHGLKGHKNWVYCLAYSPDGKWLATGGWDKTVKLRDAATGAEALTIFAHDGFVLNLAFSPDSRNLVTASEDRSARLWEVPDGRQLGAFHGHTDFVQAVAFRPDGREVVTGSLDGSVRFWEFKASRPVVVEHSGPVVRLSFRRDGLRILSQPGYSTESTATKGWNSFTGELDTALAGSKFEKLPAEFVPGSGHGHMTATSPDGKLIAQHIGSTPGSGGASRSKEYSQSAVVIRELASGRVVHTLTGHSADVVSLAFSPDGRRLATASYDRTMKLWDVETGQDVFTLRGHTGGLICLAFSPDGNQLVTGSFDATARVWNATPLPSNVIAEHDVRFRKKVETLAQLKGTKDDAKRAEILAAAGQWGMAADAFAKAVLEEPDQQQLCWNLIEALVESGNRSRVEAACNHTLKHFGNRNDPLGAVGIDFFCRLAPLAITDPEKRKAVHELARADCTEGPAIVDRYALWSLFAESCATLVKGRPNIGLLHNWLGVALAKQTKYDEAIASFRKASELDPRDAWAYKYLGDTHARTGQWKEASSALSRAIEIDPTDLWSAFRLGPVLAEQGDLPVYQEYCKNMLSRWGDVTNPNEAERVVKACLLLPGGIPDPDQLAPLVKTALASGETNEGYRRFLFAEGLQHYRCGRFADALSACRKSRERLPSYPPLPVMAQFVEAMSVHRLGKTDEARKAMAEADRLLQKAPKFDSVDGNWWDWPICRILRREAQALIEPANSPEP